MLTALFAALAAGAAWKSVSQGQRIWTTSLEPDLQPQILLNQRSGTTDLAIFNAGGGIAKGCGFVVVAGGRKTSGMIDDGFIQSGDKVYIHTELPHSDDAECVVLYRTADESS